MSEENNGKLLRVYVGTKDHYEGSPLYEKIVRKAKSSGLAGVTVFRGIEGFSARGKEIHRDSILRLSEDLPILIEIVDAEDKIRSVVKEFDKMFDAGEHGSLMTIEDVEILRNV